MSVKLGRAVNVLANEHRKLAADRDQHFVAARLHDAGHRFPLAVVLVGVDHVDAEVEGAGQLAVAARLPFCVEHAAVLGVDLVAGVGVRAEREQRHVHVGAAQPAVDHASTAKLAYRGQAGPYGGGGSGEHG